MSSLIFELGWHQPTSNQCITRDEAKSTWRGITKLPIEVQVIDLAVIASDRRERGNLMDGAARLLRRKASRNDL